MTFETLELRIENSIEIPMAVHLLHSNIVSCIQLTCTNSIFHTKQIAKQILMAWNYSFWNFPFSDFLSTFLSCCFSSSTDSTRNAVANQFKASYVRSDFAATVKRLLYLVFFLFWKMICFAQVLHLTEWCTLFSNWVKKNSPFFCKLFFGRP